MDEESSLDFQSTVKKGSRIFKAKTTKIFQILLRQSEDSVKITRIFKVLLKQSEGSVKTVRILRFC